MKAAGGPPPAGLGRRLRSSRQALGFSIRLLARRTGVSSSLISQVEHGRVMPSVRTLYALAAALELSMSEVFAALSDDGGVASDGDRNDDRIVKADQRSTIYLASGVRWDRLLSEADSNVEVLINRYEVGAESSPMGALAAHAGTEYGYVLSGSLGVEIDGDRYLLEPGDSVWFDSTTGHRLWNPGAQPAEALWAVVAHDEPASREPRDGDG